MASNGLNLNGLVVVACLCQPMSLSDSAEPGLPLRLAVRLGVTGASKLELIMIVSARPPPA